MPGFLRSLALFFFFSLVENFALDHFLSGEDVSNSEIGNFYFGISKKMVQTFTQYPVIVPESVSLQHPSPPAPILNYLVRILYPQH